jgi:transcriptional regulator with XRE-family HTH domain
MTQALSNALALGRRIRQLRRERGWNQKTIASRLGICESSVRAYEHGRNPGLPVLLRMSVEFELTLDELVNGRTPKPWRQKVVQRLAACDELPDDLGELMVRMVDVILALYRLPGPAGRLEGAATPSPSDEHSDKRNLGR